MKRVELWAEPLEKEHILGFIGTDKPCVAPALRRMEHTQFLSRRVGTGDDELQDNVLAVMGAGFRDESLSSVTRRLTDRYCPATLDIGYLSGQIGQPSSTGFARRGGLVADLLGNLQRRIPHPATAAVQALRRLYHGCAMPGVFTRSV